MQINKKKRKTSLQLANFLLMFCALLLTLVGIEFFLIWQEYNPMNWTGKGRDLILRPSIFKERIYEATPNSKGRVWHADIAINSHGFRDKEYSLEKPPGIRRIVILGDSIAFGNRLPVGATFPNQLEQLFVGHEQETEVLNLALGGYNTLQEVSTLEKSGLQFAPDLVILAYCVNDIGLESINLEYIQKVQHYRSSPLYRFRIAQFVQTRIDLIMAKYYWQTTNSEPTIPDSRKDYLLEVANDKVLMNLFDRLQKKLREGRNYYHLVPLYASQSHIAELRFALDKLRKMQDTHSFEVLSVIIPLLNENKQNMEVYSAVYDILEHEFSRIGFRTINMHSDFLTMGFNNLRIHRHDSLHPNPLGHKVIAEHLFDEIQNYSLIEHPRSAPGQPDVL
jgi:lysophospholipase L1-like esterase